jgi:hypothetical protein
MVAIISLGFGAAPFMVNVAVTDVCTSLINSFKANADCEWGDAV